jgi:hypothetical protein
MDNIYVVGHGYMVIHDKQMNYQPKLIDIPRGIGVKFYCKDNDLFDSSWEEFIVGNEGYPHILANTKEVECPNNKGDSAWEVVEHHFVCTEQLLTRPGGIHTYKSIAAMKIIIPSANGTTVTIPKVGDGDTLYINDKKNNKCLLSAITNALDGQKFRGTLHWLACRDLPGNMAPDTEINGMIIFGKWKPAQPQIVLGPHPAPSRSVLSYPDSWASKFPSAKDDSDGGLSD